MAFKTVLVAVGLLIVDFAAFVIRKHVREGYEMNYIIPAGYHGVIVARAKAGAPALPFSHGAYTIPFPKSGVLETASTKVFYEWHHAGTAIYDDGTPLNWVLAAPDTKPAKSPTVELYDLGADSDGLVYWFVGTHDECVAMEGKAFRDYLTPAQKAILWPPSAAK